MLIAMLLLAQATQPATLRVGEDGKALLSSGSVATELDSKAFYLMVGRADLAAEYEKRDSSRTFLKVAGGVLAGAGLATMLVGTLVATSGPCLLGASSCQQAADPYLNAGLGMVAAGGLFGLIGVLYDPNPLTADDRRALAEKYNERLKVSVTPARGGGALTAMLTF